MGFWSTLGKIALPAAGIAAAPFTGGTSLLGTLGSIGGTVAKGINAAQPMLGALGNVASGAAKGSADQRGSDAQLQALFHQMALQSARDQANFSQQGARDTYQSQLDGAKFGASEQQRGNKNALLAQLLGNVQDVNVEGLPSRIPQVNVTGGLRPSALGNREALMSLLTQAGPQAPQFTPGAGYQAPQAPQMPTAGLGEKALGVGGLVTSLLGALGGIKKPPIPSGRIPQAGSTYATPPYVG